MTFRNGSFPNPAELTFTNPECGTKMFIDDHHFPEYPMHFSVWNDHTLDGRMEGPIITLLYPPRNFQYIEGSRWFLVRDRTDGYLAAAYDVESVRECRRRNPELWELQGINLNLKVDKWRGHMQQSDKYWMLYLPFLQSSNFVHRCIDHDGYTTYELRDDGVLVFDCDATEVRDMWFNVRTDQWSAKAQRQVAQFLYNLQHGWDNQPPQPPTSPTYQPQSPTSDDHMDEYIDYNGGNGESNNNNLHESGPSTAVGTPEGTIQEPNYDVGYGDNGSDGFSSDIDDILNHEDEYTVTQGGNVVQYPDGTRDDDEYEWRDRSPSPTNNRSVVSNDEYEGTDDAVVWWNEGSQPNEPITIHGSDSEESDDSDDDDDEGYGGRAPVRPNLLQLEYRGRTYDYALDRSRNKPLFWYGTLAEQQMLTTAWERNELILPPPPVQCQRKLGRRREYDSDRYSDSSRCSTPDIYDDTHWEC
jgi:hypothetical protein